MIKKFLLVLLSLSSLLVHSQDQIIGHAPKIKDGTEISMRIFFPKFSETTYNKITTKVKDHYFFFPKDLEHTELYTFEILGEYKSIFLDKGKAEITIPDQSITKATILKSISESDSERYLELLKTKEGKAFGKAAEDFEVFLKSGTKDVMLANKLRSAVDSTKKKFEETKAKIDITWVQQNQNSTINSYVLERSIGIIPDHQLTALFSTMPEENRKNSWGKKVKYHIDSLSVGGIAPLFKQSDTSGKQIDLADFGGKYILLDFWASWCTPCRAENPNLVAAKTAFRDKNFVIVSVSLDEANKRSAWLKAIADDKMDWTNLSSLTGFNNEAALKYHIRFIPSNFLIDPNGKIVAKDLTGKDLLIKLEELFK